MTQQEFDLLYSGGIDAQTVLTLLMGKETIYRKYLFRFSEDENYGHLLSAVRNQNAEAAFRAVHTLKGTADSLTEQLRPVRTGHPDLNEIRPETELLGRRIAEACRVIEELKNLTET